MFTRDRTLRGTPAGGWAKPLILTAAVLLAACSDTAVEAGGEVVPESRTVSSFEALDATNGVHVILTIDPTVTGDVTLAVTADSNLQESLTTEVAGSTLKVSADRTDEIADQLFEVAGTVARLIDVSIDDGARAVLTGSGNAITLSADNGAHIDAEAFTVTTADVNADNGSRTIVCATGAVTGDVTNGADLVVRCGGTISGVSTSNGGTASTGS
jgi:hypothetical protein